MNIHTESLENIKKHPQFVKCRSEELYFDDYKGYLGRLPHWQLWFQGRKTDNGYELFDRTYPNEFIMLIKIK